MDDLAQSVGELAVSGCRAAQEAREDRLQIQASTPPSMRVTAKEAR